MVIMGKNMIYTRANWDTVILFSSNCLCDKSKEISNESSAQNRIFRDFNQFKRNSNTFVSKNVAMVMQMCQNLQ